MYFKFNENILNFITYSIIGIKRALFVKKQTKNKPNKFVFLTNIQIHRKIFGQQELLII
jgi:hypothetical protein